MLYHCYLYTWNLRFYVSLVIDRLEMLFVWLSEEGNFLDWIQQCFVCFGMVVVGTLASLDDRILCRFLCCIEIGRSVNGEYKYCESIYHTVCVLYLILKQNLMFIYYCSSHLINTNMKNVHICVITMTALQWLIPVNCVYAVA